MRFDTTRWSIVLRSRDGGEHARAALEILCRTYRPPVLAYIRCRRHDPDAAEDLTQAFFVEFLAHAFHADADPARGRFRAFLLTALNRFLIDVDQQSRAVKRGGRIRFTSFEQSFRGDHSAALPHHDETPERTFERVWALALIDSAVRRLREEAVEANKAEMFDLLGEFLIERPDDADYTRVAAVLNLRRNTLATAIHRLRHRLRELIRQELAQTVASDAELESEMYDLRVVLRGIME